MATKEIQVRHGQSLYDLAIMYYGNAAKMFRIADLNEIRVTENVKPGDYLTVDIVSNETVKYIHKNAIEPATFTQDILTGIGYMEIGDDFIVY